VVCVLIFFVCVVSVVNSGLCGIEGDCLVMWLSGCVCVDVRLSNGLFG